MYMHVRVRLCEMLFQKSLQALISGTHVCKKNIMSDVHGEVDVLHSVNILVQGQQRTRPFPNHLIDPSSLQNLSHAIRPPSLSHPPVHR